MSVKRVPVARVPRITMYSPSEKVYKIRWDFHKGDDDPNPSIPHGHSQDNKYRLSIWDGKVYEKKDGKLKCVGQAKGKEMRALRANNIFKNFVSETRSWYIENHPYCPELLPLRNKLYSYGHRHVRSLVGICKAPDEFTVVLSVSLRGCSARKAKRYYG